MRNDTRRVEIKRAWLAGYKAGKRCACGESHPACLDFHHRPGERKILRISRLVYQGTLSALIREVEKCNLTCANCHRKHHYENQTGPWAKKK